MKKLLKLTLLAVVLIVVVGAAVAYFGYSRFRSAPEWYRNAALTPAEVEAGAKSLEDKVSRDLQNQVARLRAAKAREASAGASADMTPVENAEINASFTEAELNGFWQKWSGEAGWAADAAKYVSNPVIRLADGELILAGTVKDLDTVVSLHFSPQSAPQSAPDKHVSLKLVGIRGGMLPLPVSIVSSQKAALSKLLTPGTHGLAKRARFGPDGAANHATINAELADELMRLLNSEPVEPILFLPVTNFGGSPDYLPARVTSMIVSDGKVDLTAKLLDAAEREKLLEALRKPTP